MEDYRLQRILDKKRQLLEKIAQSSASRWWLGKCAQTSEGTEELLDSLESRVERSDFDIVLKQQRLDQNIEDPDACDHSRRDDEEQSNDDDSIASSPRGSEVLHAEWWAIAQEEDGTLKGKCIIAEETGEYVVVDKSDVVDALAMFIAAYIVSLPEGRDMETKKLQRVVLQSLQEIRKNKLRRLWDYGRSIYRAAALGYGAFAAYTNPWMAEAILKAAFTCASMQGWKCISKSIGKAICSYKLRKTYPHYSDLRSLASRGSMSTDGDEAKEFKSLPRIAVAQMTSVGDVERNYCTVAKLVLEAATAGASILCLPENFHFLGTSFTESLAIAEPLDGPSMRKYADLARQYNIMLSLGGFQEKGPDPEHLYNTHVVIDNKGHIVAQYRKIHLFNVDVPGGPILMESRFTAPGKGLVVCESPVGCLGLSTCYDVRFPQLYQRLAWELGAQTLLVPSAFTVATGKAHWEVLLRARAIECQSYVVAAAQAGKHNSKRESYGHSLIIDPWGDIVARLDDPISTGIAVAEFDFNYLTKIRERMPVKSHREAGLAAIACDSIQVMARNDR